GVGHHDSDPGLGADVCDSPQGRTYSKSRNCRRQLTRRANAHNAPPSGLRIRTFHGGGVRMHFLAGDKITSLGKDRLAELDDWAYGIAKKYAPNKDDKGRLHWDNEGDEVRFMRFLNFCGRCARAARGELIRSCTVRSWRRRIRLCGRFPYRPTIGGACGIYRPPIGPVSAIERAIVCMRMPGLADLRQPISRGFLHTATSGGAPGFFLRARLAPHSAVRSLAAALFAFTVTFRPSLSRVDLAWARWFRRIGLRISMVGGMFHMLGWDHYYKSYRDHDWKHADSKEGKRAGRTARATINSWRRLAMWMQFGGFVLGVLGVGLFAGANIDNVRKVEGRRLRARSTRRRAIRRRQHRQRAKGRGGSSVAPATSSGQGFCRHQA